jgi:hypothetical protein
MGNFKELYGQQANCSGIDSGIFWQEAKTKIFFHSEELLWIGINQSSVNCIIKGKHNGNGKIVLSVVNICEGNGKKSQLLHINDGRWKCKYNCERNCSM